MEETNEIRPVALRCRFSKTGPIRYISHLDLTRTFHRALARAEIKLKFSEGFSPHPKFTFALPLSVGMESLCEVADFTLKEGSDLTPEEVKLRLAAQMPAGIEILFVEEVTEKLNVIAWARYEVFLPRVSPDLIPAIRAALDGELTVEKKNKKGKWVTKSITPGISAFEAKAREGGVALTLELGAGGENVLGPDLVLKALAEAVPGFDLTGRTLMRRALLREDKTEF